MEISKIKMVIINLNQPLVIRMLKCIYGLQEPITDGPFKKGTITMDIPHLGYSKSSRYIHVRDMGDWYESFPHRFTFQQCGKLMNEWRLKLDVTEVMIQHHLTEYALSPTSYISSRMICDSSIKSPYTSPHITYMDMP